VYRRLLREEESREVLSYSNDLHEALLKKDGKMFWNCWQAKFESSVPCSQVDGSVDDNAIINKRANHFQNLYSCNMKSRAHALRDQFTHTAATWVIAYQLAMYSTLSLLVKLFLSCTWAKHRILWA